MLIAAGRKPNVMNMGLESVGVAFDERDGIKIDDFLRTTNKHIYSVGDCAGKLHFTHNSDINAKFALKNALLN